MKNVERYTMYVEQALDRYHTELRDWPGDEIPFPTFYEWLAYEVRAGRYSRVAQLIATSIAF